MVDEAEQGEADEAVARAGEAAVPIAEAELPDPFDGADIFGEKPDESAPGLVVPSTETEGQVAAAVADVFDEPGEVSGAGPAPAGPTAELDLGIDDLAAGLQRARRADDEEIEELEELDELVVEEHPQHDVLWLTLDGRAHAVDRDRFVIGRVSAQCDLAIIDANISRQHCAIERVDGVFYVRDLGSTNGVQVEGKRVDDHAVREGDVLVLSGHRLECSFAPPVIAAPPVAAVHLGAGVPSATALTGRHASLPPLMAEDPEGELDPDGEIEPEPGTEVGPAPTAFEARVEQRLAAMAAEIATLRTGMDRVLAKLEALKNIDALAQLIQRRVQQAKQPK